MKKYLISTISGKKYPFEKREEFAENGESLEVKIEGLGSAIMRSGPTIWERFADFLPFDHYSSAYALGEGDTCLLESKQLGEYVGLDSILVKNETLNPTWSFKDRGSLPCILMANQMGERFVATISTGNMGASIAAYGARSGVQCTRVWASLFARRKRPVRVAVNAMSLGLNAEKGTPLYPYSTASPPPFPPGKKISAESRLRSMILPSMQISWSAVRARLKTPFSFHTPRYL